MKVAELMTNLPSSIHQDETLNEAARIMWELDCGFLPVSNDDHQIIGAITDRDICMAAYTQGIALQELPVSVAMSKSLYSCESTDSIRKAESLMQHHQVRRLPVLDQENRLCGILSLNDIALNYQVKKGAEIKPDEIADTLAGVCRHHHGSLMAVAS